MRPDAVYKLLQLIEREAGMKILLEQLIENVNNDNYDNQDYLKKLSSDLNKSLTNYNNRYNDE